MTFTPSWDQIGLGAGLLAMLAVAIWVKSAKPKRGEGSANNSDVGPMTYGSGHPGKGTISDATDGTGIGSGDLGGGAGVVGGDGGGA
jgi:hypothetical protein